MIKRIRFCFTLLCVLFCLSVLCVNNTYATDYVVPLNSSGSVYSGLWKCGYNTGGSAEGNIYIISDSQRNCEIPAVSSGARVERVKFLETNSTFRVDEGSYYGFRIYIRGNFEQTSAISWSAFIEDSNFSLISLDKVDEQTIWTKDAYCSKWQISGNNYICVDQASSVVDYQNFYLTVFDVLVKSNVTGDYKLSLGSLSSTRSLFLLSYGGVSMGEIYKYNDLSASEKEAEQNQEDRNNLESQQSSSESDANNSKQQAESTGGTLLSAFSAFVSALTNASPTNCAINMDLGNLDLGNVDLCQLSPPAGFQVIGSILMILFCVPLSISTARKLINLFRSFQ